MRYARCDEGEGRDLRDGERDALSQTQERALKPGDTFKECHDCPEMVVVPVGHFMMGSPPRSRHD